MLADKTKKAIRRVFKGQRCCICGKKAERLESFSKKFLCHFCYSIRHADEYLPRYYKCHTTYKNKGNYEKEPGKHLDYVFGAIERRGTG